MSARSIRRSHERAQARRRRIIRRAGLAVGTAAGAAAIAAPAAGAANFTVTTTADSGPGSLRAAVAAANAAAGADTIDFSGAGASGEITLTTGELEIDDDLTITGPGAGALSISGDSNSNDTPDPGTDTRIFDVIPPGGTPPFREFSVSGLTLKEGVADGPSFLDLSGGAIKALGTNLTLDHVTITGNLATQRGGGVYQQSGMLKMTDSTVSDNRAYSDDGGLLSTSYEDEAGTQISNSTFTGNRAGYETPSGPYGFPRAGGLEVRGSGAIDGVTVTGNSATETFAPYGPTGFGGGMIASGNGFPLTVTDATVTGNSSASGAGGVDLSGASLTDSTVSGNHSAYAGGVYLDGGTINRSTVSGNDAEVGGGMAVGGEGESLVKNSTISGNQATNGSTNPYYSGVGGGAFVNTEMKYTDVGPAELKLRGTTVADNSAAVDGGNIYAYYEDPIGEPIVVLKGTIVADGSAPSAGDDIASNQAGAFAAGFSLIESPGTVTLAGDPAGTNITGPDPKLGPLADNGGPTKTMALDPTSAAVDASQAFGLTTDQRGQTRPVDSAASNVGLGDGTDIGAFEVQDPGATGNDDITAPKTEITKAPKVLHLAPGKRRAVAKIKFTGTDDRSKSLRFQCKVDEAKFGHCKSPLKLHLRKGKHVIKVRAIDHAGNVDKSPAKAKIKVKRKHRKR